MGFVNVIESHYITSYIKTTGSAVTRSPDVLYYPSAAVPTWTSSKFKIKFIPNYDIPETTDDKPLWSFNKTVQTAQSSQGQVVGVCFDSTNVYWSTYGASGKIKKAPLGISGSIIELATSQNNPVGICCDDTYVYFAANGEGKIKRVPIAGGSVTDLATGETGAYGLTLVGSTLYWTIPTGVRSMDKGGGAVSDEVTGESSCSYITGDATKLYWASSSNIRVTTIGSGTATTLVSPGTGTRGLAVDNQFLYWVDYSNNNLKAMNKNGGAIGTVVSSLSGPVALAVSGQVFYMGEWTGQNVKFVEIITAWLTTDGKVKVVEGPTTMVETDAAAASMHQNVEIEFQPANGVVKLSGFTSGDGTYTDTEFTSPVGYNLYEGCALGGACQIDGLISTPLGS
jgi:hypothetical protein